MQITFFNSVIRNYWEPSEKPFVMDVFHYERKMPFGTRTIDRYNQVSPHNIWGSSTSMTALLEPKLYHSYFYLEEKFWSLGGAGGAEQALSANVDVDEEMKDGLIGWTTLLARSGPEPKKLEDRGNGFGLSLCCCCCRVGWERFTGKTDILSYWILPAFLDSPSASVARSLWSASSIRWIVFSKFWIVAFAEVGEDDSNAGRHEYCRPHDQGSLLLGANMVGPEFGETAGGTIPDGLIQLNKQNINFTASTNTCVKYLSSS